MAIHEIARKRDAKAEGLWSNDPQDKGGETVLGHAINYDTPGEFPLFWKRVSELKKLPGWPDSIGTDPELQSMHKAILKKKYWDIMDLDCCPNQQVANCLHTIALNVGQPSAIIFLRDSLNELNRNQKSWADIPVNTVFGQDVVKAMDACLASPMGALNLFKLLNGRQLQFYREKSNEDFNNGLVSKRVFHLGDYMALCKAAGIDMGL